MTPAEELDRLVEAWHDACASFVTLARSIAPDQQDLPTDLAGWSVRDNVAHVAHLEAVLAGGPEETIDVAPAPHLTGLASHYTEQGVLARRDRDLEALCAEIEHAVATRYAALQADPPQDLQAPAPRTPAGMPWSMQTLLRNRPLDVWMHEQDIRRAIDRPGGYDTTAAEVAIVQFGTALPMVLGKRVGAAPGSVVRVEVSEPDHAWTVGVGADGRGAFVDGEPDTTIRLTAEDFVVLAGGRRTPDQTDPAITGDRALAERLLGAMAVTP